MPRCTAIQTRCQRLWIGLDGRNPVSKSVARFRLEGAGDGVERALADAAAGAAVCSVRGSVVIDREAAAFRAAASANTRRRRARAARVNACSAPTHSTSVA